jgi:hypothetical protein
MTTYRRAFAVAAAHSWADGIQGRSPLIPSGASDPAPMPLTKLLDRVTGAADPNGRAGVVLVLASDALKFLGLPDQLGPGSEHEAVLDDLKAAGWIIGGRGLGPWFRVYRRGAQPVFVRVPSWASEYDPDFTDDPSLCNVTRRLWDYHEAVGAPYAIEPGYSALNSLRYGTTWARQQPLWTPDWSRLGDVLEHCVDRRDLSWTAERAPVTGWRHTYDAYGAHLGAASMADVAAEHLQREVGPTFDRKMAGYWLIDPPTWEHASIPSPLHGPTLPDKRGRVWVATATMNLLHELADEGEIDAPRVYSAWIAPGTRRLRPWAERIRDAIAGLGDDTSEDAEILRANLKATYRKFVGNLASDTAKAVQRPDWRCAIVAQGRAAMWRRAWRIGTEENRWPLAVATDSLTYASEHEDPAAAAPAGLRLGPWGLGRFRPTDSEPADELARELVDA